MPMERPSSASLFTGVLRLGIMLFLLPVIGSPVTASLLLQMETLNPDAYLVLTPSAPTSSQMVTCEAPCACMLPSGAEAQWGPGGYVQCAELPCARQLITTSGAAVPVTRYCYRQSTFAAIAGRRVCSAGQVSCSGLCVDTGSDAKNCGSCGHTCTPAQICSEGQCRQLMAEITGAAVTRSCSSCDPEESCCSGRCVDLGNDIANCGACGNACPGTPPQMVCNNGHCINPCLLQGIAKGVTDCGGYCVNTLGSDISNCGGCGKMCAPGQNCCLGTCSDPLTDAANCGGCMKPCGNGKCCGGTCLDTQNDPANCGGCGWKCGPKETCCEGMCVNLQETNADCGGCGIVCPAEATCKNGACTCLYAGYTLCGSRCVNPNMDAANCGACGNACTLTQTCSLGACKNLCDTDPSSLTRFSWADWRGTNWMSPVKDQGACGSCWAFAPVGATEALYNIERRTHKSIDLAEEELVSPCYDGGDAGDCLGGDYSDALDFLKSGGLVPEYTFPYLSVNEVQCAPGGGGSGHCDLVCIVQKSHCSSPPGCADASLGSVRWRLTTTGSVNANIKDVKKALLCRGPLVVASENWWHAVVLVGWDDAVQQWTVKNSWGASPGWNGYNQINYTGTSESDIIDDVAWVQGVTGP